MEQTSAGSEGTGQYPQLVERAMAWIERCDGAVDEDRLIAHVFGNGSSPSLWRPLLRDVLKGAPSLTLRPDGVWTSRHRPRTDAFPSDFVVIDVETTGLKPAQQRIIEVAVIRCAAGADPFSWTTLLNPGRRIPQYVASLTGISDAVVAGAPEFRSIAPTVMELIGDLPIVAHNAGFDIAFLNAELARCNFPRLVNQSLDTLALAQALVKESRRLSLPDVARALGIDSRRPHRALPDADTTLDVFRALLGRASNAGCTSLDDLLRLASGQRPRSRSTPPVGRGRSVLDRGHLTDIPSAPGVYIMRDAGDRVLYVGKSRDLRKRVASYYSQPLGYTRKMDGLLESLASIEVEVVGCELDALVLESQLIRRYRPRFNTIQRNAEQYVYIKIDITNPWPRVTTSKDRAADGAEYSGPFHSGSRVRGAVDLLNDILPLRTCKRSFADARSYGSPCIELSLHRCLGPCMGIADRDAYRGYIQDVLAFFRGDDSRLIAHLHARLEETVRALDFERAARLRDQIVRLERLVLEQVRLNDAAQHGHALLVLPSREPGNRDIWYLLRGQRWAALTVSEGSTADELRTRLEPITARATEAWDQMVPNHHAVDEMSLLARWMRRTPDHEALIPIDDPRRLDDVARLALAVDLAVPFGEASPAARPELPDRSRPDDWDDAHSSLSADGGDLE